MPQVKHEDLPRWQAIWSSGGAGQNVTHHRAPTLDAALANLGEWVKRHEPGSYTEVRVRMLTRGEDT